MRLPQWVWHCLWVVGWITTGSIGCTKTAPRSQGERQDVAASDLRPSPDSARSSAQRLAPVASVVSTDSWMDLIAQRPAMVTSLDGRLIVDASRPDVRRHLAAGELERWTFGVQDGGKHAAAIRGRGASIFVPLDGLLAPAYVQESGLAMSLTVRSDVKGQVMTVLFNEQPLVNLSVAEDWTRRTFTLPLEYARPGENRIRLHFRRDGTKGAPAALLERMELGTLEQIRSGPTLGDIYQSQLDRSGVANLQVIGGGGIAFYLIPPRRGRLVLSASGVGSLEVYASTDREHALGTPPKLLWQEALRPSVQQSEIDLSGYGGVPTRLEIRVQDSRGTKGAGALIDTLRIQTRRSIPVDRRRRVPRDVFILAVEGFRADELRPERLAAGDYPALSELRKGALSFTNAYARGAAAVPSHAALQTSIGPVAHLTGKGTFVAPSWTTLGEVMERAGYETQLVTANRDVSSRRGLTQGMGRVETLRAGPVRSNAATDIVARALQQLDEDEDPTFSYLVMNDPQAPYDPPQAFLRDIETPVGAPAQHLSHMWVGRVQLGKEVPQDQVDYVRELYRGELQVVDVALSQLVEGLEQRGRSEQAVIVVVGMHGEEFLEHGSAGHGRTLYEESLRVPVLIYAPQLLAPGEVSVVADLLDLAPTLLDLLAIEPPPDWQGRSLVSVIDDPQPPPQMAEASLGDGSMMLRTNRYKLVQGGAQGTAAGVLYDLRSDPLEQVAVLDGHGIGLRMMRAAAAWTALESGGWKRPRWGNPVNLLPAFALDHGM